ncbi:hypothetical protein A2716_01270 [candidate division WWE3 bacterium RIFCSPHIGHO2_01_FULL_40_23]|uniref:Uncharacterized protein n=1 Tax=candidate division WWE3 bacterium RIFCSPLOWO2_01_FULL_41_18 TaxID=1802625 RepID=A0A1F4VDL8_UNCKA|nr:MAG: hypothetical protein A2716_01270 [candidate division WWE3 bacterium RIFCSPHIGHO2_01_FULL_40_23]OGC55366.1 MAG: hypothetical protein A3A78_00175 [candidate division WWE3 bacterium RIFCSPLOWO2_01_FULL_41_18]
MTKKLAFIFVTVFALFFISLTIFFYNELNLPKYSDIPIITSDNISINKKDLNKILENMKESSVNYINCNDTKTYYSNQLKLSFICPEDFVIYECKNPNYESLDEKGVYS